MTIQHDNKILMAIPWNLYPWKLSAVQCVSLLIIYAYYTAYTCQLCLPKMSFTFNYTLIFADNTLAIGLGVGLGGGLILLGMVLIVIGLLVVCYKLGRCCFSSSGGWKGRCMYDVLDMSVPREGGMYSIPHVTALL